MKKPQPNRTRVRLTVDLLPDVYETFHQLAEASGVGIGRTIGDWLKDTQEAAAHVLCLVAEARARPAAAAEKLHSYALGLSTATEGLLDELRARGLPSPGAAAGAAVAAPGAGSGPVTPRSVIRGETSHRRGKQ